MPLRVAEQITNLRPPRDLIRTARGDELWIDLLEHEKGRLRIGSTWERLTIEEDDHGNVGLFGLARDE